MNIASILTRELGSSAVLEIPSDHAKYSTDMSGLGAFPPDLVVLPENEEQIRAVLRLAMENQIPVTPRGGGTGLTGGAIPVQGGILMSFERMSRIKDIDPVSLVVVTEPGVVTADLLGTLEREGLFLPPNPASMSQCTIGGNVAHNASGPRSFKYGPIKEYVNALNLCLIGGKVIRTGHASVKGATGYDVTKFIVGSEGTLGVMSEMTLRLLPAPETRMTVLAYFPRLEDAGKAVLNILKGKQYPAALELIHQNCLIELTRAGKYDFPENIEAALLLEFDSTGCLDEAERGAAILRASGANGSILLKGAEEQAAIWLIRREVYRTMRQAYPALVLEDVCVPRARVPELLMQMQSLSMKYGFRFSTLGHIGEGNLHVGLLFKDPETVPKEEVRKFFHELVSYTLRVGGTLTGEHGISFKKKEYLGWVASPDLIQIQKSMKACFDPTGLMNPGKIFPSDGEKSRTQIEQAIRL